MKKGVTTAAIGSAFLVLIGVALVRRGPEVGKELARRPSCSAAGPETERGVPERRSSQGSVARESRGSGASSASLLPTLGSDGPPFASREGFPGLGLRQALRHEEQDFWEDLGALLELRSKIEPDTYRAKISVMTATYLGLNSSQAVVFDRAAARAREEIGRAWKIRNELVEALPAALNLEERERHEREIQEGYEAAKTQAFDRLESLLESNPRHEYFRRRLGEWFDAVR